MSRAYHWPGDWIVAHSTARDRRSFGFWTLAVCVVGSLFFGNQVWWVSLLSLVALIPNVSSETPVEDEAG